MSSSEVAGSVRLDGGVRRRTLAGGLSSRVSAPAIWLGLCWGVCTPLVATVSPAGLVRSWLVSIPLCLALFVIVQGAISLQLRRLGLGPADASHRAGSILSPLWIVGFAPIVLWLPARSLPVFLIVAALSIAGYRWIDEIRAGLTGRRIETLERWLFVALFVGGLVLLFQVRVVHDAFQYHGYLVSIALDGDLDLYNQIYIHNSDRFYNSFPVDTGRYLGTALFHAPFFTLGHATEWVRQAVGQPAFLTGYSLSYGFWITVASSLFGLAGLIATYRLALEFFSRRTSLIAVAVVGLASSLPFFMYTWGGWAHPVAFCLVAWFLLGWQRSRRRRSLSQWAMLGALAGAIVLVRPTAGLVLLYPLTEWMAALRTTASGERLRPLVTGPGLAAVLAFVVASPQLSLWKAISGSWFAAPYREVGDFHAWLQPDLAGLLFSSAQHGLFVWTPLLLVATVGVFVLFRTDRLIGAGSTLFVLGTVYLYACWSIWWSGIGFSNRFFIELTPVFVLGLAALLGALRQRSSREWALAALAVAVTWNLFLIGAYRANDIPQGIPDPYRVVDDPLTIQRLAGTALQHAPAGDAPGWLDWFRDGFFTGRIVRAVSFADPAALLWVIATLAVVVVLATATVRYLLPTPGPEHGRRRAVGLVISAVTLAILTHVAVWAAADRTPPRGQFHRLPETGLVIRPSAPDTWVYSDYDDPVTTLDLMTHLIYGHGVPQDSVVAVVSVFDRSGREFTRLLRAGVDTVEASYPRREYREAILHGIEAAEIVRTSPSGVYSSRDYEAVTARAVFSLPEPLVVEKIRFRYVHPVGRLVVSDVFLRDF